MSDTQVEARKVRPIAALVVLSLGLFMTLLDLTIVNVAIPRISDGLGAGLDQILWVLNAYSLLYAVLLITSGRLGDIVGPRRLFVVGTGVFTVASLVSALATSPTQLILSRALQGLGAAILAPQGLPILLTIFPREKRAAVFAVFGVLAGLAVLAGPTLGGFLVTRYGWPSIFYVNLPVGALVIAAAFVFVPDIRPGTRHRLDLVGVGLSTVGLLGIVYGLIEGQRYQWGTITGIVSIPMVIAAGVVALALFLFHQSRRQDREPLLPFAVFRNRNFAIMTLVLSAMGFTIVSFYLPLTIYLQSVLGLSAIDAGLTIAAQPVVMILLSGVANGVMTKVSGKHLLIGGLLAFAAGTAYIALAIHADSGRWSFLGGLILAGAGMAFIWGPVYSLATRDLRPEHAGVASGVLNTIQELGAVLAGAVVGAVLQTQLANNLRDGAVARAASLPEAARAPFVAGFSNAGSSGLQVGAGQSGVPTSALANLPASVAAQIQAAAHDVFTSAFVNAMRPTLFIGVAVVLTAAAAALFSRAHPDEGTTADARRDLSGERLADQRVAAV
ncbi:MAG: DHA2 family efflux MFS transporter permease subunit [Candidatus Dormibacteraeota bacterium]|uniref:DHA2 family efflux MFS transporter permease subunit n=1 Tax=Candidatus Amunia macphersoniae TaxID=3127014 RepID=A0A934NDY5_9BACT|nr:DHA2 family efflux MFS transporter permease subunit [Candidatus Dormibacteraeota bacterium]